MALQFKCGSKRQTPYDRSTMSPSSSCHRHGTESSHREAKPICIGYLQKQMLIGVRQEHASSVAVHGSPLGYEASLYVSPARRVI